jgi:hypothetical protein
MADRRQDRNERLYTVMYRNEVGTSTVYRLQDEQD